MIALELEPCWQDNPIKLVDALPAIDNSPCESGCPHLSLCQSKELSCQAYHNYANSRKFENSAREPSAFFYEQTFEAPSKNKGVFVPTEQKQKQNQKQASPLEDIPVLVTPKTRKKKEKTVETQTKNRKEKIVMSDKAINAIAAALKEQPAPQEKKQEQPQGAVAIERLVNLAMNSGSSAASAAAQVLLSAWNSRDWLLSVSDLGYLDPVNRSAAFDVIDLRSCAGLEPHTQIKNGDRIFQKLATKWQNLRIDLRNKEKCWTCYGSGEVFANLDDENDDTMKTCPVCNGSRYQ